MIFRDATAADITALHRVRMAVTENVLQDAARVTAADYAAFLDDTGKGWLCEVDGRVVGFAILDIVGASVWALFVEPGFDRRGIGLRLHATMLDWYFAAHDRPLWLGTEPGTRAERFYPSTGWSDAGLRPNGERRFEMTKDQWRAARPRRQAVDVPGAGA